MIYLISTSITLGYKSGIVSLLGVVAGFFIYMLGAVFGITKFIAKSEMAYQFLILIGSAYFFYLFFKTIKNRNHFIHLSEKPIKNGYLPLFINGLLTNLFNPKIALLYISLLPQFVNQNSIHIFEQSLILGLSQIAISSCVNLLIVIFSAKLSFLFIAKNSKWQKYQKYFLASIFLLLAINMLSDIFK